MFQQVWKEQAAGVVAGSENEHQRNEKTRDDAPTLAFPLRHQMVPWLRLIARREWIVECEKLFERRDRDVAFEAVLHADSHVVERDSNHVNIFALVNLGEFLTPSIRLIEHAGVVREHEYFVGRLHQLDRRRIDVAGFSGL